MSRGRLHPAVLLLAFWALQAWGEEPPELPLLSLTLAPTGLNESGSPSWIDIATRVEGMSVAAGEPFLRIPARFAGVPGVAYTPGDIEVKDSLGAVPLEGTLDEPDAGGFIYFRRFTATRAIEGDIEIAYRAPIERYVPKLGAGPPFDLRAAGGGFSGAGNTFILMPDTDRPFQIEIRWRLDALAPGSIGVSSFGEGDTSEPGPVDRLIASYFMAGPLGRFHSASNSFSGYWIGSPQFDAEAVLQWSARAYDVISAFFGETDPPPYRVLMRGNPYPGGGGAALMSSFLVSYPDDESDGFGLRETIAHETVHNWVTSIGGPPGSTSWFSEGMTVAYTRELLLRSGLFSPAEFLDSVNGTAMSYYTNVRNDLHNDGIAAEFWNDTRVRSLPYARGSLYFAAVDAAVRNDSNGARSLDNLLLAFVDRQRAGQAVDGDTWRELVESELGSVGVEALDAMLAGDLVIPPSDAFGPCFARYDQMVRRFELGFDRSSLFDEPRIVTGLEPGSEAARAGIENGDTIVQPIPLVAAQRDPERHIELRLRRGDDEFEVEYLPRGEAVRTWMWRRVVGVPDEACAH